MSFLTRWDELDFPSLLIRTEGGNLGPLGKHIINPSSHHKIWWGGFPAVVSLHHLTHCSFLENPQRFMSKVGFTKAIGPNRWWFQKHIFFLPFATPPKKKLGEKLRTHFKKCYYFLLVVLNAQLNLSRISSFQSVWLCKPSSPTKVRPTNQHEALQGEVVFFFFFERRWGMGSPKYHSFVFLGGHFVS